MLDFMVLAFRLLPVPMLFVHGFVSMQRTVPSALAMLNGVAMECEKRTPKRASGG